MGVRNSLARELLPALSPLVTEFRAWIDQNGDEFARELAEGISGAADVTADLLSDVRALAGFGPVKVAIEIVGSRSGDELALGAAALFIGSKFGLPGLALGALAAGGYAAGKAAGDWWNGPAAPAPDPVNGPFQTPELQAENARIIAQRAQDAARAGGFRPGGGGGSAATPKEDPIVTAWKQINEQLQEDQRTAWLEGGELELQIIMERNERLLEETKTLSARMVAIGMDEAKSLIDAFQSQRDAANEAVEATLAAAEAERELARDRMNNAIDLFKQLTGNGMSGELAFAMAQTAGGLGGQGTMGTLGGAPVADGSP
jgi:hypothetical protein